jgi:hypothetical protein
MVDPVVTPKANAPMNTAQILLSLNKQQFAPILAKNKLPQNLSDNNALLRRFTFLDSRAATELGNQIRQLPNCSRKLEKTESTISKFRAAKTPAAASAFNLLVEEIQGPTSRTAEYAQKLTSLKRGFIVFISELHSTMSTLLPQASSDSRITPYVEKLNAVSAKYTPLVRDAALLEKDGTRLADELGTLNKKSEIMLSAAAPEVVLAEKNKAAIAQRPAEQPPSNFSPE